MSRNERPGCLMGLLQLFLLDKLFDWLQRNFGFGRGGLLGCGCGPVFSGSFPLHRADDHLQY